METATNSTTRVEAELGRPLAAALLLGLGLGGFFDGIVLHQVLQWHHMLSSAGYPPTSLRNLEVDTFADGLFHAATWIVTVVGLTLLWTSARVRHAHWPAGLLAGGVLLGWGAFNMVEGLVDHHLLGLHHVNETAPRGQWWVWDTAFLIWGMAMLVGGWLVVRRARADAARTAVPPPPEPDGRPALPPDRAGHAA